MRMFDRMNNKKVSVNLNKYPHDKSCKGICRVQMTVLYETHTDESASDRRKTYHVETWKASYFLVSGIVPKSSISSIGVDFWRKGVGRS